MKGAYVTRVAILLMHDMILETIPQPSADPWRVPDWWIMGPTPWALTMHQMKNVIPAIGATTAFTVNK